MWGECRGNAGGHVAERQNGGASQADRVNYKDLREFIKQVAGLQALRHVAGADAKFEIGGITEVARWTARLPGAVVRPYQGLPARFPCVHQRDHLPKARGPSAGHRSRIAAARCAKGLEGQAPAPQRMTSSETSAVQFLLPSNSLSTLYGHTRILS
jgi:hypothetical protein